MTLASRRWIPGWAALLLLLAAAPSPAEDGAPAGDGAPVPKLVVDREEHDFGVAAQEQELHAEFTITNAGTAPLKEPASEKSPGIKPVADCGCYGTTLSATEIPPGGTATLKVSFRTLMLVGPIVKKLTLHSNDPARPMVAIRLKILVGAGVVVDPGRIYFGDVLVGSTPSGSVFAKWLEGVGKPFQVTAVEVPGHAETIRVTTTPHEEKQTLGRDAENKPIEGLWKGTRVTFAFTKPPPVGMLSATALLRTDHPEYPRIAVPLTVNVSGRVWVQQRTLTFGWVKAGETKRNAFAVRPFNKDVKLGSVKAEARGGKVLVEVTREEKGPSPGWRVAVSVPKDAPPGKIDDVIDLTTDVPGEERIEVAVRGEVLPGPR
jgi:hypothetical protein